MGEPAIKIDPIQRKKLRIEQKIAKAKTRQALALQGQIRYRKENEIEFFTRPNPRQEELLEAWNHPHFKVFTFCGANRIGKEQPISSVVYTPGGPIQMGDLKVGDMIFDRFGQKCNVTGVFDCGKIFSSRLNIYLK